MSYHDTLKVIETVQQESGNLPEWIQSDFFLPTRNIKRLMENEDTICQEDLEAISNLVGISDSDIVAYIEKVKEKQRLKTERKNTVERFRGSPLGSLQIKHLRHLLHVVFEVPVHSKISTKADFLVALENEILKKKLSESELRQLIADSFK